MIHLLNIQPLARRALLANHLLVGRDRRARRPLFPRALALAGISITFLFAGVLFGAMVALTTGPVQTAALAALSAWAGYTLRGFLSPLA